MTSVDPVAITVSATPVTDAVASATPVTDVVACVTPVTDVVASVTPVTDVSANTPLYTQQEVRQLLHDMDMSTAARRADAIRGGLIRPPAPTQSIYTQAIFKLYDNGEWFNGPNGWLID